MSKIGAPSIPAIRSNDVKSLQNAFNAVTSRLLALEESLGGTSGAAKTNLLAILSAQPDGIVVKISGQLVTRQITGTDGVNVKNPTGATGDLVLSTNLADSEPNGFVVKSGDTLITRVLVAASGSGITITDEDGVANDPTFHVP